MSGRQSAEERKAQIVAEAGHLGAVTIATNMAGRGTDIQLGGNREMMLAESLASIDDDHERARQTEKIEAEIAHTSSSWKEEISKTTRSCPVRLST